MTNSSDPCELHWYVAYVKSCQERNVASGLSRIGIENYLPIQREVRQWSDRRKIVERLLLPRLIFVRCTGSERVRTLEEIPYLYKYITVSGAYTPAVVRDSEMEAFRAMVDKSGRPVAVSDIKLAPGDHVRVISGPLSGIECELVAVEGRRCLAVRLGSLGTATMDLSVDSVDIIDR